MDASARPAVRPVFRFLAWLMATLLVAGMAAMAFVLLDEAPPAREVGFFIASFIVMAVLVWACIRIALARVPRMELAGQARGTRMWRALVGVYALSLLVVLSMMLTESGSWPAWGGLLLSANLAGCALFLFRRPDVSGR